MFNRQATIALLIAALAASSCWTLAADEPGDTPTASARQPIPTATDQERAGKMIHRLFSSEYADRTPAGRSALAKKLLKQGSATQYDPAARYVSYCEARDLATSGGDMETAFAAIDALDGEYALAGSEHDAADQRATTFFVITPLAGADAAPALVERGLGLLDPLLASENFPAAQKVLTAAGNAAARSKELPLVTRVQARRDEVAELQRIRNARLLLKSEPDDPSANLTVGRQLAFVNGNWPAALPLLAKGSDPALKDLASRELARPDPKARVALANAWSELASKQSGPARGNIESHSKVLLEQALPGLSGADKAAVEMRLGLSPGAGRATTTANALPPSGSVLDALPNTPGSAPVHTVPLPGTASVSRLEFLATGRLLCGLSDHNVALIDPATDKQLFSLVDAGRTWAWSDKAGLIAAGNAVCSLSDGHVIAKIPGPPADCLAVSLDARHVVLRGDDGAISDFDVTAQSRTPMFDAGGATVQSSDDGNTLLRQAGNDIRVYSDGGRKLVASWDKAAARGFSKALALLRADGGAVLILNDEENKGAALVWDWRGNTETELTRGHRHAQAPAWSPDGKFVLFSDWFSAPVYDTATKAAIPWVTRADRITTLNRYTFTPDSRRAILLVNHDHLRVFDLYSRAALFDSTAGDDRYADVIAISRDSRFVAVPTSPRSGGAQMIRIWRLPDEKGGR